MSREALEKRVAALERQLGSGGKPVAKSSRSALATEIAELERRLDAMSYMDDDLDMDEGESFMDEEDMEEVGMDDLEVEPALVDEATVVDEVGDVIEPAMNGVDDFDTDIDEELDEDLEVYCRASDKNASLTKPGVEDRISQDYLSEVEDEAHGEELATDKSMLDAAPTRYSASEEYVSRLKRASARLDRVANYLEKHGRIELAKRIDEIADAIDARINRRA